MLKQKNILKFEILCTIIIIVLGVLFHFTYELSNKNILVGLFTPVNESIWEHLKLIYFPMIITTIIGYFYYGKDYENYIGSKTLGILGAMIFTVIGYYTYSGILGQNIDWINISLFFISVIFGQFIVLKNLNNKKNIKLQNAIIILIIFLLMFIIFTFTPPKIGLFKNPITGTYGI